MALSPIDVYKILPKRDCGECGEPTCFAFATKVVVEKLSLSLCPYIEAEKLRDYETQLKDQHRLGKWVKKDLAKDALKWAKEKAASLRLEDIAKRIGGEIVNFQGEKALKLPYFNTFVFMTPKKIQKEKGDLDLWEQVFLYNHMAQGGSKNPTGEFIPFHEIPNTISKEKSMKSHVQKPLEEHFKGKIEKLKRIGISLGAEDLTSKYSCDLALLFKPLPKIRILLLFWDEEREDEHLPAQVNILFDKSVIDHLDVESILFLCEHLVKLLINLDK